MQVGAGVVDPGLAVPGREVDVEVLVIVLAVVVTGRTVVAVADFADLAPHPPAATVTRAANTAGARRSPKERLVTAGRP